MVARADLWVYNAENLCVSFLVFFWGGFDLNALHARSFGQNWLHNFFQVLHCNYNGEISQKLDLVITFDWRVLLT